MYNSTGSTLMMTVTISATRSTASTAQVPHAIFMYLRTRSGVILFPVLVLNYCRTASIYSTELTPIALKQPQSPPLYHGVLGRISGVSSCSCALHTDSNPKSL